MDEKRYGTTIERGFISAATDEGYTVQSAERDGIVTPPLFPITPENFTTGDLVYFFLFRDGKGKILGKA